MNLQRAAFVDWSLADENTACTRPLSALTQEVTRAKFGFNAATLTTVVLHWVDDELASLNMHL